MAAFQKALIEIQETQSFERLESYKDSKIWSNMTKIERDLFALLLIRQGAQQLEKGEGKILDNFALAAEVGDNSPNIFYQQGLIFSSYPENNRTLHLASEAFSKAVGEDPNFFMAWYHWASVFVAKGVLNGEPHYFIESNKKFEKALELFSVNPSQEIGKDILFWKWGTCLSLLGRHSGEPIDFYHAIHLYRCASQHGCEEIDFFNDHGHALADLATLMDKEELFLEAGKLFHETIQKAPELIDGWYNRACCFLRLCEIAPQEEYFDLAMKSFERAAEIDPLNGQVWYRWGQLEANLGKLKRSQKILESSLEKFAKADELGSEHHLILRSWAETELYLGSHVERLDLIQSARVKIIKCLELDPDSADAWYIYGACLNELGHYFEEEDFFYQALEKFHYGLTLAPQHPLLWYGLALSHFAIGEMSEEITMLEKSIEYCNKVMECGGEAFPQFWNDWGVALLKLAELSNQATHIELAIEKFERALKRPLDSDYEDVDLEWVYNYGCAFDLLGELNEDSRQIEKAVNILSQVVQLEPNYIHARYNLALALAHLGEITCDIEPYYKAIDHFHTILEVEHEDEMIHMDFGVSLINLALLVQDAHQPERSQAFFRQAEHHLMLAASLGNCQAYYQLAGLYSLTNHFSLAMNYIERAQFFGALPSFEDLVNDDWLDNLRETSSFRQFLSNLSSQQSKDDN
ncbi:MAG: hypothetical protein H0W88_10545 [Parachlamydiaceae bacterium]|nr:hypothetical protein [Parachlamydiaceae bacterium]